MKTRTIQLAVALTVIALVSGCGPTKSGIEARSAAQDRMSAVSAQIHYNQAKQSYESGQFDKAEREIARAIDIFPNPAEYSVLQGRIFLETHKLEPALASFEAAIQKNPTLAEPHYFTGIVYQRWSNDREAHESYLKAFELEPTKAQYLLAAVESLITLGEFEQAKELIESKLAYFEHNAALRQLQGQIALLQGQPKQAAALYAEARLLNPEDQTLLEELTWAQYAAGQYGECHQSVKLLQEQSRERRSDLLHLEARCLTMMDRGPEARELYIELTRMRPADTSAWSELGTLCWNLGDFRRVAQCSVQLISLAPDRYEGYMLKGINERQKGNLKEAAKLFAQASERADQTALPHLLLGQTFEQTGEVERARVAYHKALAAQPDSTEAQDLLGRLNEAKRLSSAPAN